MLSLVGLLSFPEGLVQLRLPQQLSGAVPLTSPGASDTASGPQRGPVWGLPYSGEDKDKKKNICVLFKPQLFTHQVGEKKYISLSCICGSSM